MVVNHGNMASEFQQTKLTEDEVTEMRSVFDSIDTDSSGVIDLAELRAAFERLNIKIAGYKVRELVGRIDKDEDSNVNWSEFQQLVAILKKEGTADFTNLLRPRSGIEYHTGMTQASAEGTTHAVSRQEQVAFADWINKSLASDADCSRYLPIESGTNDIFNKVNDGVLLCKLINLAQSNTIDERVINRGANLSIFKKQENQTLALTSAESIGCCIVNIRADDLIKGKPHLVLGLLWQIIKVGLLGAINLHDCKQLCVLLRDGESIEDLQGLSPEDILMRWVNYHMERAGTDRRCHNFSNDITDSEIYLHLLNQIAPQESGVYTGPIHGVPDPKKRADLMLNEAAKIDCRAFVTAHDVVTGNAKLNLAFVANLFNNHPALDMKDYDGQEVEIEEDRDEKRFRNWMNSLGLPRFVYYMYSDLNDGILLLRIFDHIKPNTVDWKRVNMPPFKFGSNMKKIENCNYAVELGHSFKFSLVGIAGKDIAAGQKTLTLALVWQMMRAYTLALLTKLDTSGKPIQEAEIVAWANTKYESAGATYKLNNFKDKRLHDSRMIIDLIHQMRPNIVNYDFVLQDNSEESLLQNAKYALTVARKTGAHIYALPEDIVDVNPKMILTIYAGLMLVDKKSNANGAV